MDYIAAISTLDEITQKHVKAFLDQIDPTGTDENLRMLAFQALRGQALERDAFEAYSRVNTKIGADGVVVVEKLNEVQHPHYALSSGSHPKGHESFFVGQNLVGETLSLRLPGAEWFDDEGNLLPEARAFFDLIKFKGLSPITHARNDDSMMLAVAYEYNKGMEEGASLSDIFISAMGDTLYATVFSKRSVEDFVQNEGKCLIDYAKACSPVYETVKTNGMFHYVSKGINFNRVAGSGDGAILSKAQQFKVAMAAELLMNDVENARFHYENIPDVMTVLQSDYLGMHMVYIKGKFHPVVEEKDLSGFLRKVPERWALSAHALSVGYERFKKYLGTTFLGKMVAASTCTDSRTPARVLFGASDDAGFRYYALRSPGNSWATPDGTEQTLAAKRFRAIATLLDIPVAHSHHSVCGAMTAADMHAKGLKTPLALAMASFGESRVGTHKVVEEQATTEEERVALFTKQTGVAVQNDADCLGLQQLLTDMAIAEKENPRSPVYAFFINTSEGQNYLLKRGAGGKLESMKVPLIPALLSKKPDRHVQRDRSHLFPKIQPN